VEIQTIIYLLGDTDLHLNSIMIYYTAIKVR